MATRSRFSARVWAFLQLIFALALALCAANAPLRGPHHRQPPGRRAGVLPPPPLWRSASAQGGHARAAEGDAGRARAAARQEVCLQRPREAAARGGRGARVLREGGVRREARAGRPAAPRGERAGGGGGGRPERHRLVPRRPRAQERAADGALARHPHDGPAARNDRRPAGRGELERRLEVPRGLQQDGAAAGGGEKAGGRRGDARQLGAPAEPHGGDEAREGRGARARAGRVGAAPGRVQGRHGEGEGQSGREGAPYTHAAQPPTAPCPPPPPPSLWPPFRPLLQIRLEQEARAEQIGQRKARRAVEQRLKELEEREFKRLLAEEQQVRAGPSSSLPLPRAAPARPVATPDISRPVRPCAYRRSARS